MSMAMGLSGCIFSLLLGKGGLLYSEQHPTPSGPINVDDGAQEPRSVNDLTHSSVALPQELKGELNLP